MRISILDGFRGFFLVFMGVAHFNMVLGVTAGRFSHHSFGWVEDAQGFVFISGIVVGLVYGKRLLRRGFRDCSDAVFRRIGTIYSHQAGLIVALLGAALILSRIGAVPALLAGYAEHPVAFTLSSLSLVSASSNMGILPMYIWFMALTPMVLAAFRAGRAPTVLALSALAWLFAQTDIGAVLLTSLATTLFPSSPPTRFGLFFDVFAWQLLFFSGLWFGFAAAEDRLDLNCLKSREARSLFHLCLVAFFALGIYDRLVFDHWLGSGYTAEVLSVVDRGDLSPLYVIAFAVDLYIVAWLLVAGRAVRGGPWKRVGDGLDWLFTRRVLVFLGQHSLHVFTGHIVIFYALSFALEGRDSVGNPSHRDPSRLGVRPLRDRGAARRPDQGGDRP